MNFTDYMLWKALALCGIVLVVSFMCRLITGKSLAEVLRGTSEKQDRD